MDRNFGDDLMLVELLRGFPKNRFYINCDKSMHAFYHDIFKEFQNFVLTDIPLKKVHKFGFGFFQFIVLIGGSTLQGSRNKGCYYRFLNVVSISLARIFKTKYCIVGCNTGPFINKFTEFFVKLELRCASFITTRDDASFNLISIANKKAKKYKIPDMLFDLGEKYNTKKSSDINHLGICAFNSPKDSLASDKKNSFFAEVIDEYINITGGKVSLFAFDIGKQNDMVIAKKIYDLVNNKSNVNIVSHSTNYYDIVNGIAECSKVVAVRFHSAIIALSLNIPVIPVIYSNKMSNLLDDLGYNSQYIYLDKIENMDTKTFLNVIMNSSDDLKLNSYQICDAKYHLLKFREFMEKEGISK